MEGRTHHDRFPIRVGRRSRLLLRLFGVRNGNAWVELVSAGGADGAPNSQIVDARFGFFRLTTPLANISSYRIEGPWLWITAIGVRTGFPGLDVTFGGSPHGGIRLNFRERVRFGPLRIPALYVTADNLEGLAAALAARGIPGEDARKRRVP
jgi:hypothetical protein